MTLPKVTAGAYRLRYSTRDPFGATYETSRELLVIAPGATPLALPAVLRVEKPSVPVGGTIRVLVHSGLPTQQLVVEIHRRDKPIEKRVFESSQGAQVLTIPVGDDERGGVAVVSTGVRDHQLMQRQEQVLVPWDEKELRVEFATFRDRVRPRSKETWRVTVKGADDKAVAAGAAELLAYMYDRSLDLFAPHEPPIRCTSTPARRECPECSRACAAAARPGRRATWRSSPTRSGSPATSCASSAATASADPAGAS